MPRRCRTSSRLIPILELFAQPVELKNTILRDKKTVALEIRENGAHPAKRRKRGIVRVLHQEHQAMPWKMKIVPTLLNGRFVQSQRGEKMFSLTLSSGAAGPEFCLGLSCRKRSDHGSFEGDLRKRRNALSRNRSARRLQGSGNTLRKQDFRGAEN